MQIQTKMRYHLIPVRMAITNKTSLLKNKSFLYIKKKRQVITSVGEDVEKKELSFTAGGNVNW